MIGLLLILLIGGGFVAVDRNTLTNHVPDYRFVITGSVLAAGGAVTTMLAWWIVVPPVAFLTGCALIVIGRHRTVASTP